MLHLCDIMDSKICYIHDAAYGSMQLTALRRRNKDGSYLTYRASHALSMCNKFMGGVDLWDMVRTGWYGMEMRGRCRRWTFRFYEIQFSMACANANMIITYLHKIK